MPRIRTLKPEHRQHRKVGPLPDRVYRLWVSMILEADDHGRLVCDADQLKAVTWPYHPRVTTAQVEAAVQALAQSGMLHLYVAADVRYAEFTSWKDHQRISHPAEPKLPSWHASGILRNPPEPSTGKGREVEVEGKGTERSGMEDATPPAAAASGALTNGPVRYNIPQSIIRALERAPRLGAVPALRDPAWWQAVIRARPGVDMAIEVLKAEAWMTAHPEKRYRKLGAFLHGWIGRAERPEEDP